MKTHINVSSMRAALNSAYCMRAVLDVRKRQLSGGGISEAEAFHYRPGQHAVNGNRNGKKEPEKVVLSPQVGIISTPTGKRWSTPAMEVELRGDVLEIRDGFGNIIDSVLLQ